MRRYRPVELMLSSRHSTSKVWPVESVPHARVGNGWLSRGFIRRSPIRACGASWHKSSRSSLSSPLRVIDEGWALGGAFVLARLESIREDIKLRWHKLG